MFKVNHDVLINLCNLFSFELSSHPMIILGIRGCKPMDTTNCIEKKSEHSFDLINPDHEHCNCTFIQWYPLEKSLSCFVGSTVPHKKYVREALTRDGSGANQMLPGHFSGYVLGIHKQGSPTAHRALRQTQPIPILRSKDDLVFDNSDEVEFDNPFDNIHAAWCDLTGTSFASAGCQVITGYPACEKRSGQPNTGHWNKFIANVIDASQSSFNYILFRGSDLFRAAIGEMTERYTYGSRGDKVGALQLLLIECGFDCEETNIFDEKTLDAMLKFQGVMFGPDNCDGVVGPNTLNALIEMASEEEK